MFAVAGSAVPSAEAKRGLPAEARQRETELAAPKRDSAKAGRLAQW